MEKVKNTRIRTLLYQIKWISNIGDVEVKFKTEKDGKNTIQIR